MLNATLDQNWCIARDADNSGREQRWYDNMPDEAQPAPAPGIIQQVFPDYFGVAWYWVRFRAPRSARTDERVLLRFGAVDYLAEVWVNGVAAGGHEGGETPFELDVTAAMRDGDNLLALRVVNPTNEPIDGLLLREIPHRNKCIPSQPGSSYNYGGIMLPVEVLIVPAVRIADIFAQPDWQSGEVQLTFTVRNATGAAARGRLSATIAPQHSGEAQEVVELEADFPAGDSTHSLRAVVARPRLWSIDDPYLYLLTAELQGYRKSMRIGFRDFRVEDGWFCLNGKRLFLKSTHTGNHFPIGVLVPQNPELMYQDLLYAKACGYNCVRFISGVAWPVQLDYCDEIGLMVYEECLAGWCLEDSAQMTARYDLSVREMILRDRNHPCLTIWGLLNETRDGPVFRHAVDTLQLVRELDPTRLVLLNSGRWDCQWSIGSLSNPGSSSWEHQWGMEAADAPPTSTEWSSKAGGYFDDAGDAHTYPCVPQTAEVNAFLRNLGRGMKPVFLSEYGIGSLMDVIGDMRKFEETGCRPDLYDYAYLRGLAERLEADWQRWGFTGTYPFAEDMLRDSQRLHMRQRRLCFDLVRSNPQLCGFNLTGMLDHAITGEGMWTFWRKFKPMAADTLRDGWAPLRWCLFVTPTHGHTDRAITLEAVLANEDVLPPGDYPVTFRITGTQGIVWELQSQVTIPQPAPGERTLLAVSALNMEVQLEAPAGEYTFAARLQGGAPAGDRASFTLSSSPAPCAEDAGLWVTTWGVNESIAQWLSTTGLQLRHFTDGPAPTPEVILVGLPEDSTQAQWQELAQRLTRGSAAVFLQPDAFRCGDDSTYWLPLERKGECHRFYDWLYHKECVGKRHPIFAGLQAGGILDWDYYDQIIGHSFFTGQDAPEEVVCAAFAPCAIGADGGYISGTMIATHRLGAGLFILNTLNIVEQVGKHPAAERLLMNLIRYAHGLKRS